MSKLAQVAAEQSHLDYFHIDMHQFNDGGVSEITPVRESEVLSMEQFLKAEKRLAAKSDIDVGESTTIEHTAEILQLFRTDYGKGHDISHNRDLQTAHIGHTGDEGNYIEGKIYNYSVADTVAEQNGKPSDADITTAGGYLKKGISDPGAHQENEKKKRSSQRLIQVLNDQDALNQYLEHLDEHIKDLQNKIEEYDNQIAEMNDVLDVLESGDINANSGAGRARREKINAWAKENNVDLDKFKKADGSLDQDKIQEFVEQQREEVTLQRDDAQNEMNSMIEDRAEAIILYEQTYGEYKPDFADIDRTVERSNDLYTNGMSDEKIEQSAYISLDSEVDKQIVSMKFNNLSGMFDFYTPYDNSPKAEPSIGRSNGSFITREEGGISNIISAKFAMASNHEINTQPEISVEEHYTAHLKTSAYGI